MPRPCSKPLRTGSSPAAAPHSEHSRTPCCVQRPLPGQCRAPADATDQQLQEIAAETLKEEYFQDGGRRAGSLEEVRFTDIEHLEFDL